MPPLTLLIDGDCPLCKREAAFLMRRDRHERLAVVDIAAPEFDAEAHGVDRDAVHAHIHAIAPDGTVVSGVEVFRRAYGAVGLGWLLAPTAWPLLRPLFDAMYRLFARHRIRIGRLFGRTCDEACAPR